MAVLTVCPEIFVRIICIEVMVERFSKLPVGKRRHDIDFRKKVSLAVSTLQTVVDGSLFYSQGSGVDNLVSEIDVRRKTEITYNPQIQISAESGTKRSIFRQKNKTKRSKKRLHTTLIKPEQKVNEDLCSGFIVS